MADNDEGPGVTVADKVQTLTTVLAWLRADLTHVDTTYTRANLDGALREIRFAAEAVEKIRSDLDFRRRELDRE